jgi:hypothetical protein
VCYSRKWLRSTGQFAGDAPGARGVVTFVQSLGDARLATVDWGKWAMPPRVHVANLAVITEERGVVDEY